jgi:hypothetical protein
MLEMALFALEGSFHRDFDWTSGVCRLSFDMDVNRLARWQIAALHVYLFILFI